MTEETYETLKIKHPHTYALAQVYEGKLICCMDLKIKKIDGIPVTVCIEKHTLLEIGSPDLYFQIKHQSIRYRELDDEGALLFTTRLNTFHIEDPIERMFFSLLEVEKVLNCVKYDKKRGRFIKSNENRIYFVEMLASYFDESLKNVTNIEYDKHVIEDCCVCLEETVTKTPCKHALCLQCWGQVKKKTTGCPICRGDISYFNAINWNF